MNLSLFGKKTAEYEERIYNINKTAERIVLSLADKRFREKVVMYPDRTEAERIIEDDVSLEIIRYLNDSNLYERAIAYANMCCVKKSGYKKGFCEPEIFISYKGLCGTSGDPFIENLLLDNWSIDWDIDTSIEDLLFRKNIFNKDHTLNMELVFATIEDEYEDHPKVYGEIEEFAEILLRGLNTGMYFYDAFVENTCSGYLKKFDKLERQADKIRYRWKKYFMEFYTMLLETAPYSVNDDFKRKKIVSAFGSVDGRQRCGQNYFRNKEIT